jgi:hypothetical protein
MRRTRGYNELFYLARVRKVNKKNIVIAVLTFSLAHTFPRAL